MERTWISVTVELLGGRGNDLWPWPGRVFAVGPSHTFRDLANAINAAFGRWDHAHLSEFELGNGEVITDLDSGFETVASEYGTVKTLLDIDTQKVLETMALGDEFQFVFDLGDEWMHRCVVGDAKIDPLETLGIRSATPLPYWGWGQLPDQYGRRTQDDDGEQVLPQMPSVRHPMLTRSWPEGSRELDQAELRAARAAGDPARIMAAVRGCDIDQSLQFIGAAGALILDDRSNENEAFVLSLANRLTMRSGPGDAELSADLLALLRDEPYPGEALPVDLEMLAVFLEELGDVTDGAYVHKRTGSVIPNLVDDFEEGLSDEELEEFTTNPDLFLLLDRTDSHEAWSDMAAFAGVQRSQEIQDRLSRAIEGKGAFRAFRHELDLAGLGWQWTVFSAERQQGRARATLADHGIRAVLPRRALRRGALE